MIPLLIYLIIAICALSITWSERKCMYLSPSDVYDDTDFNYATCIIIFIILVVLDPFLYFVKLISYLMHVGRKKDE